MTKELTPSERKSLRGQAHHLEPVVIIGQNGVNEALIGAVDKALTAHELIKIKFNEFKEDKGHLIIDIADKTSSHAVAVIGNVAIVYRENPDEKKRKIKI